MSSRFALGLLSLLAASAAAQAQTTLTANLTNAQENPPTTPTTSTGAPRPASFGTATFTINAAMTSMTFSATVNNIDFTGSQTADVNDNLVAAHIHAGPTAVPGQNAPVVWGFFGTPFNDNSPNDMAVEADFRRHGHSQSNLGAVADGAGPGPVETGPRWKAGGAGEKSRTPDLRITNAQVTVFARLREVRFERRFTRCSQSSRDGIEPLEQIFSRSGSSDEAYGSASELNSRLPVSGQALTVIPALPLLQQPHQFTVH